MPKISSKPLARICVRIWKDDDDALEEAAALGQTNKNHLIRAILNSYVKQMNAVEREKIDSLVTPPRVDAVAVSLALSEDQP